MARELKNKLILANIYRERAEELRTIADGLTRDLERNLLVNIADDYERQAKSAEARARRARSEQLASRYPAARSPPDDENSPAS